MILLINSLKHSVHILKGRIHSKTILNICSIFIIYMNWFNTDKYIHIWKILAKYISCCLK